MNAKQWYHAEYMGKAKNNENTHQLEELRLTLKATEMAHLHCISPSFSLSLNTPSLPSSSSSFNFRSLGSTISYNGYSKGYSTIGLARPPRRLSVVCEATDPVRKADSALKRERQNEKRRLRNKARKSEYKTRMKKVMYELRTLRKKNEEAKQEELLPIEKLIGEAYKAIDKAAKCGAIHKNTANRRKSFLARNKKRLEIRLGWYVPPGGVPTRRKIRKASAIIKRRKVKQAKKAKNIKRRGSKVKTY